MEQQQLANVNVYELAAKCKSKKEIYNFLTQDCQAYLPRMDSTNIYFFKQIMRGQKDVFTPQTMLLYIQYVRRDHVKVSAVPHIEGLTVHDFMDFVRGKANFIAYLPDERDWVHLDRQWVGDILYTIDAQGIQHIIETAMKARKEKLEQNRDLIVQMRPEFVQALDNCLNFSTERGKSANLMKDSSKRKRTREEITQVHEEEKELHEDRQQFLQTAKRLKNEHTDMEDELIILRRDKEELINIVEASQLNDRVNEFRI